MVRVYAQLGRSGELLISTGLYSSSNKDKILNFQRIPVCNSLFWKETVIYVICFFIIQFISFLHVLWQQALSF